MSGPFAELPCPPRGGEGWTPAAEPSAGSELVEFARQLAFDLVDAVLSAATVSIGDDAEQRRHLAQIFDRLGEDCAEASGMARALPGRPGDPPEASR